tara:strand:+ start:2432 stop:3361 length:930 start_codon:yes stop_codon:yes gene_type:complete
VWIEVPFSLLGDQGLSSSAKVVLMVLSTLDTPYFTYEKLGRACGLSIKEVRAALNLLRGEATSKRKPKHRWLKTQRVKHEGSTATRFTILNNLTKGKVYRQEDYLTKGKVGGANLTKGQVYPTSVSLTKGKVGTDENLTKGKVSPELTPLIVKELNKFNSSLNINTARDDLALFGEEEMDATKEIVPIEEIYKIYNDVRTMVREQTGLPGYKGIKDTTKKREEWAAKCWFDDKTWNRSLDRVRVFFETAATYDNYNLSGRNRKRWRGSFLYMTQNEERRTEINEEVRGKESEPGAQSFTNKWGEFYETV